MGAFREGLRKVLNEYRIPCFHMKDLVHGKKHFSGWGQTKRELLIERFLFIITTSQVFPVSSSVSIKDYRELELDTTPRPFRDPYYHCLVTCLANTVLYCTNNSMLEGGSIFSLTNGQRFPQRLRLY